MSDTKFLLTSWTLLVCAASLVFFQACGLFTPANAAAVAMIDGAVCHLASEQRSEAAWESFVCKIIDPLGKEASFRVDVPKEQAKSFGKAHAPRAGVRGS